MITSRPVETKKLTVDDPELLQRAKEALDTDENFKTETLRYLIECDGGLGAFIKALGRQFAMTDLNQGHTEYADLPPEPKD